MLKQGKTFTQNVSVRSVFGRQTVVIYKYKETLVAYIGHAC